MSNSPSSAPSVMVSGVPARPTTSRSALGWRALRYLLAILPLAWLLHRIDPRETLEGALRVGPFTLALCLLLQLAGLWALSLRWRMMLSAYAAAPERLPTVTYLFRSSLIANYGALLPVPAADEGVRAARTRHVFPGAPLSPYLVLVAERTVGLTGLLLTAMTASLWSQAAISALSSRLLMIGTALAAAVAALVLLLPRILTRHAALRDRLAKLPKIGPTLVALPTPKRIGSLVLPILLSAAIQWSSALIIWLLMVAIDPAVTLGVCAQVQPVVLLVMAVPLTPGGIGQRELAFATLYGLAGVAPSCAVIASLMSFALSMVQALIGGGVLALERSPNRS